MFVLIYVTIALKDITCTCPRKGNKAKRKWPGINDDMVKGVMSSYTCR